MAQPEQHQRLEPCEGGDPTGTPAASAGEHPQMPTEREETSPETIATSGATPVFGMRSDVVLRALKATGLGPVQLFFAVLAINVAADSLLAMLFGAWRPFTLADGLMGLGLSREPGSWAIDAVAQPMIIAYFLWLPTATHRLFQDALSGGWLKADPRVVEMLGSSQRLLNSNWVPGISVTASFLINILVYAFWRGWLGGHNPTWVVAHPVLGFWRMMFSLLGFYALGVLVLSWGITVWTISRVMRADLIDVLPFDPDRAGGLGQIGRFMSNHGYFAFAAAAVIAAMYWETPIVSGGGSRAWLGVALLATLAYVVVAPLFFLLPLRSTHDAMLRHKRRYLEAISAQMMQPLERLAKAPLHGWPGDAADRAKLQELHALRRMVESFPTWPFTVGDLRRYCGWASAPLVAFGVGVAVEWVAGFLR